MRIFGRSGSYTVNPEQRPPFGQRVMTSLRSGLSRFWGRCRHACGACARAVRSVWSGGNGPSPTRIVRYKVNNELRRGGYQRLQEDPVDDGMIFERHRNHGVRGRDGLSEEEMPLIDDEENGDFPFGIGSEGLPHGMRLEISEEIGSEDGDDDDQPWGTEGNAFADQMLVKRGIIFIDESDDEDPLEGPLGQGRVSSSGGNDRYQDMLAGAQSENRRASKSSDSSDSS